MTQLLGALGIGEAPPPQPLLWRRGGHPQLPATLQLAALQRTLHEAAALHFQQPPR